VKLSGYRGVAKQEQQHLTGTLTVVSAWLDDLKTPHANGSDISYGRTWMDDHSITRTAVVVL
jgi:hypothetical protein